jgi:glycogen debranching enzyme
MLDVGSLVNTFYEMAHNRLPPVAGTTQETGQLKIIPDKQYRRLKATVDMELALRLYNVYRYCT